MQTMRIMPKLGNWQSYVLGGQTSQVDKLVGRQSEGKRTLDRLIICNRFSSVTCSNESWPKTFEPGRVIFFVAQVGSDRVSHLPVQKISPQNPKFYQRVKKISLGRI